MSRSANEWGTMENLESRRACYAANGPRKLMPAVNAGISVLG